MVDLVLSPSNAAGCRRKLAFPSPHAINEQTVPTLNQPIRKRKLIRPAVSFLVSYVTSYSKAACNCHERIKMDVARRIIVLRLCGMLPVLVMCVMVKRDMEYRR